MRVGHDGDKSSMRIHIRFSRRYGYYLFTIYLPTTFVMLVAYSTFFFKLSNFLARIISALMTFLLLTSIYTQVSWVYLRLLVHIYLYLHLLAWAYLYL